MFPRPSFDKRTNWIAAPRNKALCDWFVWGYYVFSRLPTSEKQRFVCQLVSCEVLLSLQLIGPSFDTGANSTRLDRSISGGMGNRARRSDDLYGHVSEALTSERRPAWRAPRRAREGSRHLADLGLGTSSRRSARLRARAEGAGTSARRQGRDRRQQPPAALLVDVRGSVARRRTRSRLSGLGCRRDGLCARACGREDRGGREPGASR